MTTIAFDGRYVAADTLQGSEDHSCAVPAKKLRDAGDKVYAITGYFAWFEAWIKWYEDGADPRLALPCGHSRDTGNFIVFRDGRCFTFDTLLPYPDEAFPPFAFGSGSRYAIGAMLHGANAKQAVEYAIKVDPGSGGQVQLIELKTCEHTWVSGRDPASTRHQVVCVKCGVNRSEAA